MARMIDNRVFVDPGGLIGTHIRAGHFCAHNSDSFCSTKLWGKHDIAKSLTTMLLVTTL